MNELDKEDKLHFSISMPWSLKQQISTLRRAVSQDRELSGRNQSEAIAILVRRGIENPQYRCE